MSAQRKLTPVSDPARGDRVLKGFDLMRKTDSYRDFTLVAQDHSFPVHKQLMAVSSEYFQGCFRSGMLETQTASMDLQSVSAAGLKQVLDFLYTGGMALCRRNIHEVLETAVFLHVDDAVKLCSDYIFSQLKMKTVREYRKIAESYQLEELCAAIDKFVLQNFHKFIKADDFLQLSPLRLVEYLKDDRLRCSEFKLYKALEKWIFHDVSKREICTEMVLSFIRFASMTNEELNRLRKHSLFYENHVFHELIDEGMSFRCATLQKQLVSHHNERMRVRSTPHIVTFANSPSGIPSCILLNNKWYELQIGAEQPKSIQSASLCVFNDFLFVCGGDSGEGDQPSKLCYCFKPHSCSWTRISNMRVGRKNFALVAHSGFLYAIGGIGERNEVIDSVEKYDTSRDMWSYACAMGRGLSDIACCTLGDSIFIAGGMDENCFNVVTFKTFLPRISMWQRRADILSIKFKPKLFTSGDKLFLVDLYKTDGVACSIECYSPVNNQWTVLDGTRMTFSRCFTAVSSHDWLYFVGRNEVEDGHSKRYNMVTGKLEDIADFPWPVDAPLCTTIKIPFSIIKNKIVKR